MEALQAAHHASVPGSVLNAKIQKPVVISRAVLEAYERQSGLEDVARFLVETGRVSVVALSDARSAGDHGKASVNP